MQTRSQSPHIEFDDRGGPWLKGANTKVIEMALSHVAYGWSADALHENYPHLSLAEIYAALAYYYDNKEGMDRGQWMSNMREWKRCAARPDNLLWRESFGPWAKLHEHGPLHGRTRACGSDTGTAAEESGRADGAERR